MPLDPSHRSAYNKAPPLDQSVIPPRLRQGNVPPSANLSYEQFEFDKSADKIGEGGNAVVYKASVSDDNLTIALKQPIVDQTSNFDTVDKILAEANNWDAVDDHPYIATVIDWGYDAYPWIAIEYLDGGTLMKKQSGMSLTQRLWTAYAVADAVAYASGQHGITHHDLTPQNILIKEMPDGIWDVPKVCDWGVGKKLSEHDGASNQATQRYAAPEQCPEILPETEVSVQTDVYQLGVICYELLTGEYPYHLTGNVSPPSTTDPSLPTSLDDVILKALAHERRDRYDHPVQFRDALANVLSQLEVSGSSNSDITNVNQSEKNLSNYSATIVYNPEGRMEKLGHLMWESPLKSFLFIFVFWILFPLFITLSSSLLLVNHMLSTYGLFVIIGFCLSILLMDIPRVFDWIEK